MIKNNSVILPKLLENMENEDDGNCDACKLSNSVMLPHNFATSKDKYDLLEVIVLDYKGPMKNC